MSRGTKVLKLFIFIGVFISVMRTVSSDLGMFENILGSLVLACTAYITATLFGVILALTRNYLIAIIAFLILLFWGIPKLDSLSQSVSWLTNGFWEVVIIVLGILLIGKDILYLVRSKNVST